MRFLSLCQFAYRLRIMQVFSKRTPRLYKSWTSVICFLTPIKFLSIFYFFLFIVSQISIITIVVISPGFSLPTALTHHAPDSCRPMLEMTIPSVLDPTLAPPGCHVVSLFTQFTPYHIEGKEWTQQDREAFADTGMGQKHRNS